MTTLAELTTGDRELPLPIRIVSDWHLGHPGSRLKSVDQIVDFLEGVGTLVMCGDGREELVEGWQVESERLWLELQEACQERGVEFVALTGNHDPEVSREGWMKLLEGRILITHGDMIYDQSSPWSREYFSNKKEIEGLVAEYSVGSLDERWHCARKVGVVLRPDCKMKPSWLGFLKLALWPPARLVQVGKVWAGFMQEGERFVERFAREAEVLVCGHFHRAGDFQVGHRRVLNMGSMMRLSKAFAVDFDGAELKLIEVKIKKAPLVKRGA